MPRASGIKRYENTPILDENKYSVRARLRSVTALSLRTIRAIESYFYDNDIESAPMSEIIGNIPEIYGHEVPKDHLNRLLVTGYLWIVYRDPKVWGQRHLALTDRGHQVIKDYQEIEIEAATEKAGGAA